MPGATSYPPLPDDDLLLPGRPPGWGLYWGNTAILVLLLLLLAGAAWLRYPDTVTALVAVEGVQAPVRLVAEVAGELVELHTAEGDTVVAGQLLAVLGSAASRLEVERLKHWLARVDSLDSPNAALNLALPELAQLGELQAAYGVWQGRWTELRHRLTRTREGERLRQLQQQLPALAAIQTTLDSQVAAAQTAAGIARQQWQQFEALYQRDAASQLEVAQAHTQYLRLQQELARAEGDRLDNRLARERLELERIQLREGFDDLTAEAWPAAQEAAQRLRGELAEWERHHLLIAPRPGRVSFPTTRAVGQYLAAGDTVLAVEPPSHQTSGLVARGHLPAQAGQVGVGAAAHILLDAYPSGEFGTLEARVSEVARVSADESGRYRLELVLPQGLYTTQHRQLPFRQGMTGQAIITTAERSLLQRLFYRLRAASER